MRRASLPLPHTGARHGKTAALQGGPLVFGLDETIERRSGPRIEAKGVCRDAVRSSQSHFVKAMGLRWISLMWIVKIPWAGRVWVLPFLMVLAPSVRYHAEQGRRHMTLTPWARQMLACLHRWRPDRELVVVADQAHAALYQSITIGLLVCLRANPLGCPGSNASRTVA